MERIMRDRNILDNVCVEFCKTIDKYCRYIVVSGFVAISSGRTRGTEDIDVIVERIGKDKFGFLHRDLMKRKFNCMQGDDSNALYDDYLKENLSIRYTYGNLPLPEVELKLAKDGLDKYQLKNRIKLKMTGLDVWFSTVDANIAFKEELLKSDKDMEDAKHLRIVYANEIDENEINRIKEMVKRFRL